MLTSLKFVQGAVAKKDFVPALTHFRIEGGKVMGHNGRISLCAPISIDLEITPQAIQFVKAIEACKSTINLSRSSNGKLYIKSGSFKAFVQCMEEEYPDIRPEGDLIPIEKPIVEVLRRVAPFIAQDASRPWARGVLFRGKSLYATNNIVLIEYWTGYQFPVEIIIPNAAVQEILRIKEEPESIRVCENSVTFHYKGDRWLKAQLSTGEWPDVSGILDRKANADPLPEGTFEACETLLPFVTDDKIFLSDGRISTTTQAEALDGASVEVDGIVGPACFNVKQMLALKGVMTKIDLSSYPAPSLFYGDSLRGAFVGIRV